MNLNEMPKNNIISSKEILSEKNKFKKYLNEYKLEEPNIIFSDKDCEINLKLLQKLDTKTLFDKNNNIFFQKLVDNLITAKFYKSDYDEEHKYYLFKLLQNSLDYLISKKKRITKINSDLTLSLNNFRKKADELEKKLESNKILIEEKADIKNKKKLNYEELKKKYEEMKNKNKKIEINSPKIIENKNITNIEANNIKVNISQNKQNEQEITKKFFCNICKDKYFLSQENLEDHQIKRHPFIIIQKPQEKKENELKVMYDKKLESLKNYIQNTFNNYKNNEKNNESLNELLKRMEDNKIFLDNMIENQQKSFEETKSLINGLSEAKKKCINELSNIYGLQKTEAEIKKEKAKKRKEQKNFEKSIKERILNEPLMKNLSQKIKDFQLQLDNYILSRNISDNLEENKNDSNIKKSKNLTIIEEFPISRIKEEDRDIEKMDISDNKNEKIINSIIKSSIKEEEKSKTKDMEEEKSQNKEKKEEKEIKERKQEIKQNEEQIKIENKKEEGEEDEEEEEEENDSILSNKPNTIPLEINRIIKINDIEQEKEISNFVDDIFNENNINFNLNKNINNKNVFEIEKNSDSNNIKLKNENKEKEIKKAESIIFEIPIQTNKKFKDLQTELDELLK